MIRLVNVYDDIELSERLLFELLRRRLPGESISHKEMPNWDMHRLFIAGRPYLAWYLVEVDGLSLGAVYLSKQREIGVAILPSQRGKGYGQAAVEGLMLLHPGRFLWNVAPLNTPSIALARKLGFGPVPVQYTYAKEIE